MLSKIRNIFSRSKARYYRNILGIIGVCGTCFMIEACYGTPQADYDEMPDKEIDVQGHLRKGSSSEPLANVRLLLTNPGSHSEYTAVSCADGSFVFEDVVFSRSRFYITLENNDETSFPVIMDNDDLTSGFTKTEITIQ